jgi:hypothetical protein
VVTVLMEHVVDWKIPDSLMEGLVEKRDLLSELIDVCRGVERSPIARLRRNDLLSLLVRFCLKSVKSWVHEQYRAGVVPGSDVHLLGFLLPGEQGGARRRLKPTNLLPMVKVKVVSGDLIRVMISQDVDKNAAQASRGWPHGVRYALIVIYSADDNVEVSRLLTTRLNNSIRFTEEMHGKQMAVRAAFLVHVNDSPVFQDGAMFSMPRMTKDLFSGKHRGVVEENREQGRKLALQRLENEAQALEIERLRAELKAKK